MGRSDAAKGALDGLMRTYADVRSGVAHLAAMVAALPLGPGAPPAVPFDDELMGDVLAQVGRRTGELSASQLC